MISDLEIVCFFSSCEAMPLDMATTATAIVDAADSRIIRLPVEMVFSFDICVSLFLLFINRNSRPGIYFTNIMYRHPRPASYANNVSVRFVYPYDDKINSVQIGKLFWDAKSDRPCYVNIVIYFGFKMFFQDGIRIELVFLIRREEVHSVAFLPHSPIVCASERVATTTTIISKYTGAMIQRGSIRYPLR